MKRAIILFGAITIIVMGIWIGLYPLDWQGWLGFTKAAYLVNAQNYALYSGFLPCFLTTIGMTTIIGGLWHAHNCHFDGCWKIGKHKVNGTPWCNLHHEDARHAKTQEELLSEILEELKKR